LRDSLDEQRKRVATAASRALVIRSESETGDEVGYCSRRRSRRLVLLLATNRARPVPGERPLGE